MMKKILTYRFLNGPLAPGVWMFAGMFILILSSSCRKSLNTGQPIDDKLVVLAEITASDSMKIPIGKTIKVGGGGLISFEKVAEANVTITDQGNHKFVLQPSWSTQYAQNPTTVYTSRTRFRSNTTYFLEIKHPTLGIATATAFIPPLPYVTAIDTMSDNFQGRDVLAMDITWKDAADKDEYYIIEVLKQIVKLEKYFYYHGVRYNYDSKEGKSLYEQVKNLPGIMLLKDTIPQNTFLRVNLYTDDNNSDNAALDLLTNPFRRIFFKDNSFNGQIYTTRFYMDRQLFFATDPVQKGRIRVQFKSVDKQLYDYLLAYEKYKTDFGSVPTSQLVSPSGNILNGLGIFGGSARRERIYYFDKF